jgi:hypothetical protein
MPGIHNHAPIPTRRDFAFGKIAEVAVCGFLPRQKTARVSRPGGQRNLPEQIALPRISGTEIRGGRPGPPPPHQRLTQVRITSLKIFNRQVAEVKQV